MNEARAMLEAFQRAQGQGLRSALAVVIRIEGSSYRQPGAKMLIVENGEIAGAVSGGCLERDLIRRASRVVSTHQFERVTYDTRLDLDESEVETESVPAPGSGLGIARELDVSLGCEGVIEILLTPSPGPWLECYSRVAASRRDEVFAFSLELGAELPSAISSRAPLLKDAFDQGQSFCSNEIFFDLIHAPARLVVFGAGHDAIPLTRIAHELGWHTTVVDCRSGFPQAAHRFSHVDTYLKCGPEDASRVAGCDSQTLAILMTHNLDHDRAILGQLLPLKPRYLGLLGPRTRAERLLAETATVLGLPPDWALERARFPVGLDLGGEGPAAIALSAISEIQAVLHGKKAEFMKDLRGPIHPRSHPRSEEWNLRSTVKN